MEKRHNRKQITSLPLVSLMDIFTILVFFLLVNSADVEVLPNAKDLQLPESIAEEKARETVVIMVTSEHILVQGRVVASTPEVMKQKKNLIPTLEQALRMQTDRVLMKQSQAEIEDREITIMGDKGLPYHLLKRVMATCTAADYGRISLAVLHKTSDEATRLARGG
jgi:biopolymer transport protein ExbD